MALGIIFEFGPDLLYVTIKGNKVEFSSSEQQKGGATIEDLQLSHEGVLREFPDLVDSPNWKQEAVDRFKHHIKNLSTQEKKGTYIIEELKKHGYNAKYIQVDGHRRKKINGDAT